MHIILVGQGPFGEKVLEKLKENKENVLAVFTSPDKKGELLKTCAQKYGLPLYQPKTMRDPNVYEIFKGIKPELSILAFVTEIIPENVIKVPFIGTICYHPSLLPKHRGASAINWAIINGEKKTGLTIFWVEKGIDAGPILLQKEVEIGPEDTAGSLYFNHLFPMGVDAIIEAVGLIKRGEAPKMPQDESKATYEPPCDDRVSKIDLNRSITEIYNLIRGCDPQPGAYTFFKGKKVRFYEAKKVDMEIEKLPGEIISIREDGLEIALKGGIIRIGKVRIGDGEKIKAKQFSDQINLKIGDCFG